MKALTISGGHLVTPTDERFCDLQVVDRHIKAVGNDLAGDDAQVIDARGCYVTPGLCDLQVNGGPECDFWGNPNLDDVRKFACSLAANGVTTILPTLVTGDIEHLRKTLQFFENKLHTGAQQLSKDSQSNGLPVRMPGIHLEGPCLSPKRPGVHPPEHIQKLSRRVLEQITTPSVKLVTVAPETEPEGDGVEFLLGKNVQVALGHSDATFEEAKTSFKRGVALVTHLFNAMAPLHHRAPGAVTAALLDENIWCCVICDGQHLAPDVVKLIYKLKGANKMILVTDIAHIGTSQGGLVGSSILLNEAVTNCVKWGVCTFQDAIKMASFNPSKAMGWSDRIGTLVPNALADIVVWDKQTLAIKHVISDGKLLSN